MQSITYSTIPLYLHGSAFYRSLNDEDKSSELQVPSQCYKPDDSAETFDDFLQLLRVMQFWGVDQVLPGIIQFCSRTPFSTWATSIPDLLEEFSVVADLRYIFKRTADSAMSKAIEKGRTEIVTFFIHRSKEDNIFDPTATMAAAKWGSLEILQMLHTNEFPWHEDTCSAAAGVTGSLDCLVYAHRNGAILDKAVYCEAAKAGRLDCIQYAHDNAVDWDVECCGTAATYGKLSILAYIFENGCPWDEKVSHGAAENGHLDCLQYALERGVRIHHEACNAACRNGHLACLAALIQHGSVPKIGATVAAAYWGHVDCLKYLREHGCDWYFATSDAAAENGKLNCLRYALEHGCEVSDDIVKLAAQSGSVACLEYLVRDRGLPFGMDAFGVAFARAHVECVHFMLTYTNGSFVKYYSYDHDQYMDFLFALPTSKYSRSEFDERLLKCIQCALEHGWQYDSNIVTTAFNNNFTLCKDFMKQQGWVKL